MEVGVLVLTLFTYIYGSKVSAKQCGQWMTFNPSSPQELEELKFILDSSYMKKGILYVEDNIKEDYKNKAGIFAEKIVVSEEVSISDSLKEELVLEETKVDSQVTLEERKEQLTALPAAEVKKIAESLGIEYTNKAKAIEAIVNQESESRI